MDPVQTKTGEPQIDPSKLSIASLLEMLSLPQILSVFGVVFGIFFAGFGVAKWSLATGYDTKVAELRTTHMSAIDGKDEAIARLTTANTELSTTSDEILREMSNTTRALQRYRAKGEFLSRYIYYIENPDPGGTMFKLFSDYVCSMWRRSQEDVFETQNVRVSLDDIRSQSALSERTLKTLESAGITRADINQYRNLDGRRNQISPRGVSRVAPFSLDRLRANVLGAAEFEKLQDLEGRIRDTVQKSSSTKIVTFADGTSFTVPAPVSEHVHRRTDCRS